MQLLQTTTEIRDFVSRRSGPGHRIGLVPTMGALHAGHLSLVEQALAQCDTVVTTIFVNPTQFAPQEDFLKYPRTQQADCERLEALGCHAVFAPMAESIYPPGFSTGISAPKVALELEGQFRPTHFSGVCVVCAKLFNLVGATDAYFGLKDYQQFAVLRQMVDDLNMPLRLHGCTTVREPDGLAMSSRNRYLSPTERSIATTIYQSLQDCHASFLKGEQNVQQLKSGLLKQLNTAGISDIHYATVRDATTLQRIEIADENSVALIAARVGTTRLIDNLHFSNSSPKS